MNPTSRPTPVRVALAALAGVVLLPGLANAQDEGPRVEGRVIEAGSGNPIASAAVRVVTEDGQQVLGSGYTDETGRYGIYVYPGDDPETGPVVVEAGYLGYAVSIGEPFELDLDGTVEHPDLVLEPEAIMLDTLQVQRRRHWSWRPPPRERVLQRQLQGRGTFLAGATVDADSSYDLAEILVRRIEGLVFMSIGGRQVLQSTRGRRCMIVVVNEWLRGLSALRSIRTDHVGAVEVYLEFDDVPEELRHHILQWRGGLRAPRRCGLISVWLWDSWNRGINPGG